VSVEGHDVAIKSQRREGEQRSNAATAASELAKLAAHAKRSRRPAFSAVW
jgi:hypothetical protein